MPRLLALLLAAVIGTALLPACSGGPDRTGRTSEGFYAPGFDVLWDTAQAEMRREGFAPDRDASSKQTKILTSRWTTQLMPFSGAGYRDQATLKFFEIADKPNYYTIEANVIRENNMNVKDPGNPRVAKWENGTRVPEVESSLVNGIEMFFIGHDVSPQFRARYGMTPGRTAIPPPPPAGSEKDKDKTDK